MTVERRSIGRDSAIALFDTEWWKDKSPREIAGTQLFTKELCCPFEVFHEAVEKSLSRPVWTHEFGLNYEGICREFLGEGDAPTLKEIIEMIPEEKRIIIMKDEKGNEPISASNV
jgi:hypothetical protein